MPPNMDSTLDAMLLRAIGYFICMEETFVGIWLVVGIERSIQNTFGLRRIGTSEFLARAF